MTLGGWTGALFLRFRLGIECYISARHAWLDCNCSLTSSHSSRGKLSHMPGVSLTSIPDSPTRAFEDFVGRGQATHSPTTTATSSPATRRRYAICPAFLSHESPALGRWQRKVEEKDAIELPKGKQQQTRVPGSSQNPAKHAANPQPPKSVLRLHCQPCFSVGHLDP